MTRFAIEPDTETDHALNEQPAPVNCEQCGSDIDGAVQFDLYRCYIDHAGGAYTFCSEACWRQWCLNLNARLTDTEDA